MKEENNKEVDSKLIVLKKLWSKFVKWYGSIEESFYELAYNFFKFIGSLFLFCLASIFLIEILSFEYKLLITYVSNINELSKWFLTEFSPNLNYSKLEDIFVSFISLGIFNVLILIIYLVIARTIFRASKTVILIMTNPFLNTLLNIFRI